MLIIVVAGCTTRTAAPVEDRRAPTRGQALPPASAPVPPGAAAQGDWRPSSYTVKRGDTLQAIALEYGLDYRELAAWNGIDNPNLILVGQVLRLRSPGDAGAGVETATLSDPATGVTTAPLRSAAPVQESRSVPVAATVTTAPVGTRNTETMKVSPKAVKEPYSEQLARDMARAPPADTMQLTRAEPARAAGAASVAAAPAPATTPPSTSPAPRVANAPPSRAPGDAADELEWTWPVKGKLVTGFSDTANLKGIDIAGVAGQPVVASAPGRVVYAGSGLRGYGKLVIVKHNSTYLSAYAHNREIVVKEGEQVTRGQKIAEMGSTDADQVKLHFEIRRLGRPTDPLKYLPPA